MAALIPHRDVQSPLRIARALGVVVAAIAISLRDAWPGQDQGHLSLIPGVTEQTAWLLLAIVGAGSLLAWGWARGSRTDGDLQWIGSLGFALDALLVFGMVWVFLPVAEFVLVLLPYVALSAALRYRWLGAALSTVGVAAFLAAVFQAFGEGIVVESFLFFVIVSASIACVTASVAQSWHKRRLEFERQAARLIELDQLKDRYIAVTSHEIRGPVSTMVTAVDTVRARWDKLTPERRDHLLEMVFLQGRELDRLVQDLFISAEMQGGGLNLQPEWVELESTVKRAIEAASGKRRAHLLEIFVDPLRAELDPYRVTQVVRNLVENAYKYTDDRTRVVVSAKEAPGGVQLEVRDDGEGIPADKRDKLFEAFSRIEETAAGQEGVGLGLYVVSQLVAAMNGRIDLQSSRRGTTFSIFIPCSTVPIDTPHIGLVGGDEEEHHG